MPTYFDQMQQQRARQMAVEQANAQRMAAGLGVIAEPVLGLVQSGLGAIAAPVISAGSRIGDRMTGGGDGGSPHGWGHDDWDAVTDRGEYDDPIYTANTRWDRAAARVPGGIADTLSARMVAEYNRQNPNDPLPLTGGGEKGYGMVRQYIAGSGSSRGASPLDQQANIVSNQVLPPSAEAVTVDQSDPNGQAYTVRANAMRDQYFKEHPGETPGPPSPSITGRAGLQQIHAEERARDAAMKASVNKTLQNQISADSAKLEGLTRGQFGGMTPDELKAAKWEYGSGDAKQWTGDAAGEVARVTTPGGQAFVVPSKVLKDFDQKWNTLQQRRMEAQQSAPIEPPSPTAPTQANPQQVMAAASRERQLRLEAEAAIKAGKNPALVTKRLNELLSAP